IENVPEGSAGALDPYFVWARRREVEIQTSGRWGPYRQASSPPARHRPGARSARRERCHSIVSQTKWRNSMKRHSSAVSLALAVFAVVGLAGPVSAGEPVPFKGSLEGNVTVTPLAPPFVMVDVEATGNATHLGLFTLDIPHVVNRADRTAAGTY